jgi:hypothetical protein
LSGNALACAEAFGNGDAQKGARFILAIFGAVWLSLKPPENDDTQGAASETPPCNICEQEGCITHAADDEIFAWGFGVTAHINPKHLGESLAAILAELFKVGIETTEDVSVITTAVIDRGTEFGGVLAPRVWRVIVDTFRDLVKAGVSTLEKQGSAIAGEAYTVERRSEVSAQIDKLFATNYPPPPLVEFTRMRGGASATAVLPTPSREQLLAYAPLVKRLTPLWKHVTSYRRDYPDTWESDVNQWPEVKRLGASEIKAMGTVIAEMKGNRLTLKGNHAPIRPATCAREHARIILGISQRPDKKLIEAENASTTTGSITPNAQLS